MNDNSREMRLYHKFMGTQAGGEALHRFDMAYLHWLRESGKGAVLEREFQQHTREGDEAKKNLDSVYEKWFESLMSRIDDKDLDPLPKRMD